MNNYLYTFYTDNLHYEKFADDSVKCIEDEIPFELPEGWSWARIFSITEELPYGTAKKSSPTGLVAVLRMGNIQSGEIDYSDLVYSSDRDDIVKYTLIKNDLLFNRTNSAEWVGKTAIYRGNMPAIYAGYLIRIRTFINAEYLNVVMNSGYAKSYCNSVKTDGVNQSNINAQKLGNFLVPIPSFGEQHRISSSIADILPRISIIQDEKDYITDLIQKTKSKILDLAIRGKLVPQNPDDEPASVLLDRIRAEKEELINQGKIKREKKESVIFRGEDNSYYEKNGSEVRCIDEEIPFELPDGWNWARLKTICSKIIDGSHNPPKGSGVKTPYIMVSSRNIIFDAVTDLENVRYLNEIDFERENSRSQLTINDVLLTTVATLGRSCIYNGFPENLCFQRSVTVITTDILPQYLKIFFDAPYFQNLIVNNATGTAQKGFYLNQLEGVLVCVPPTDEQKRLSTKVGQILTSIQRIGKSLS